MGLGPGASHKASLLRRGRKWGEVQRALFAVAFSKVLQRKRFPSVKIGPTESKKGWTLWMCSWKPFLPVACKLRWLKIQWSETRSLKMECFAVSYGSSQDRQGGDKIGTHSHSTICCHACQEWLTKGATNPIAKKKLGRRLRARGTFLMTPSTATVDLHPQAETKMEAIRFSQVRELMFAWPAAKETEILTPSFPGQKLYHAWYDV